jgi:protease II
MPAPWIQCAVVPSRGFDGLCHARGGGENGIAWRRVGSGENLPNRIADTIACAQFLIEHGYSSPRRLAAARLQAATSGTQPILLRVDWQGGHAASGVSRAERIAFVLWQLGHPNFQPRE